jgi:hypothetical protein
MGERIEQNYGNLAVSGVMIALREKEYTSKKVLTFGIKTNEDRIVYVILQGYNKEYDDMIYTDKKVNGKKVKSTSTYGNVEWLEDDFEPADVKLKLTSDGEIKGYVAIDAIKAIMENFKNGDSIFALLNTEASTYYHNIQFNVAQLYKSSNEVNFKDEKFVEKNEGKQWLVLNEVNEDNITGFIFNKKEEKVDITFELNKNFITQQMIIDSNLKQGNLIEVKYEYGKKPLYEEKSIEVTEKKQQKFVPIGKYEPVKPNTFKQVTGYEEKFICNRINNAKLDVVIDVLSFLTNINEEETPF